MAVFRNYAGLIKVDTNLYRLTGKPKLSTTNILVSEYKRTIMKFKIISALSNVNLNYLLEKWYVALKDITTIPSFSSSLDKY